MQYIVAYNIIKKSQLDLISLIWSGILMRIKL